MDCAYCASTLDQGQRIYNLIDIDCVYHCCNDICARLLAKTWDIDYLECADCDDILAKNTGVLRGGVYRCHACHDTFMSGVFTAAVYDSEVSSAYDCDGEYDGESCDHCRAPLGYTREPIFSEETYLVCAFDCAYDLSLAKGFALSTCALCTTYQDAERLTIHGNAVYCPPCLAYLSESGQIHKPGLLARLARFFYRNVL